MRDFIEISQEIKMRKRS